MYNKPRDNSLSHFLWAARSLYCSPFLFLKYKKAQAILEYTILFAVIILALVFSGFLGKAHEAFRGFFDSARQSIAGG